MTKTHVFALGTRGDHVAYLYLLVGDDHPIDQELHQTAFLLEGGIGQAATHSLAEILYGTDHAGEFRSLLRLRLQLPLLARERLVPLLQIPASPLILRQRDHLPEVRLGQPLKLTPQGSPTLAEVLLASFELLRQPMASVRPLQCIGDALWVGQYLAQVLPDQLVELVRGGVTGGTLLLQAGLGSLLLAGADVVP